MWFMKILQIVKMTTKCKHTFTYTITICEDLENGSSKSKITREQQVDCFRQLAFILDVIKSSLVNETNAKKQDYETSCK